MDPLRRAMDREIIKKPRRQRRRNTGVGGVAREERNTGNFSKTDRKEEGMNKTRNN